MQNKIPDRKIWKVGNKWLLVPQNTNEEHIIDLWKTLPIQDFLARFEKNLVDDNNGKPDTTQLMSIVNQKFEISYN